MNCLMPILFSLVLSNHLRPSDSAQCFRLENQDIDPDVNLATINGIDFGECCDRCHARFDCAAFTHVGGKCYLKHVVRNAKISSGVVAGIVKRDGCSSMDGIDIDFGNDLAEIDNKAFGECCAACSNNNRCSGWTWVAAWCAPPGRAVGETDHPYGYDYQEVLHKSILFYEAQRSGKLPVANRIPWRADSALNDKGENGEDLTGGWYDAGDHVKFGFPMAASVTNLAWGIYAFWDAYVDAEQLENALDSIKWPLDYFLKAKVSPTKFYGQCGVGEIDHAFWGSAEDMTMHRPCFYISDTRPGSELAGETASALAVSSLVFRRKGDTNYADKLFAAAKDLYNLAYNYRDTYTNAIPDAGKYYKSWSGYNDELAVASLWMYKITNDASYLTKAREFYPGWVPVEYSWDNKNAAALILFHQLDPTKKVDAKSKLQQFVRNWANGENGIVKTPKGLSFYLKWASLRYATNAAFIALLSAKEGIMRSKGIAFAKSQINYALGDAGHSYVCGFGHNPPVKPHHASSSCRIGQPCDINDPNANPHTLTGALVGGPDRFDNWADDRRNYVTNEVTTSYNAGFQSAVAGVIHFK